MFTPDSFWLAGAVRDPGEQPLEPTCSRPAPGEASGLPRIQLQVRPKEPLFFPLAGFRDAGSGLKTEANSDPLAGARSSPQRFHARRRHLSSHGSRAGCHPTVAPTTALVPAGCSPALPASAATTLPAHTAPAGAQPGVSPIPLGEGGCTPPAHPVPSLPRVCGKKPRNVHFQRSFGCKSVYTWRGKIFLSCRVGIFIE